MRERKKMATHVNKAFDPDTKQKSMVIEMDNMDNLKTGVPQMAREPKSLDKKERLTTHITGVHVPGQSKPFRCYTWHDRFPSGSDAVMTMVLCTLLNYEGPIPEVLYLHLDNCWRENKNKYVLALMHLLVGNGIFKKVKVCFLPVGHTHNIVDQMFSCFSRALKCSDIFTVDDLHRVCKGAYTAQACKCGMASRWQIKKNTLKDQGCDCPEVEVGFEHIDVMACWTTHLLEHIPTNIIGVSKPRCFKIERDGHGVVRHHYRQQLQTSRDQQTIQKNLNAGVDKQPENSPFEIAPEVLQWMPHNQEGFRMFNDPFTRELTIYQVPVMPIDTAALEDTCTRLLPYMNEEQTSWWRNRINIFKAEDERSNNYSKHNCFVCFMFIYNSVRVVCVLCYLQLEYYSLLADCSFSTTCQIYTTPAFRACSTCVHLRAVQMQARSRKTDAEEDKKLKSASQRAATSDLKTHMQDSKAGHKLYPGPLFPPSRFVWYGTGYTDEVLETLEFTEAESKLVETLVSLREEGKETHYVNVPKRQQRGRNRPSEIQVGHYVVCRGDGGQPDKQEKITTYPWYIGEVFDIDTDQKSEPRISVCEYGTGAKKVDHLGGQIDPSKIRWEARFQGTEPVKIARSRKTILQTRDEYYPSHQSKSQKPSVYKAVTCQLDMDSIIDWDTKEGMFWPLKNNAQTARRSKGLKLRGWVAQEVSKNYRVPWNSTTGPTNKKRTQSQTPQIRRNKKAKK
jgi:hypothetical protein